MTDYFTSKSFQTWVEFLEGEEGECECDSSDDEDEYIIGSDFNFSDDYVEFPPAKKLKCCEALKPLPHYITEHYARLKLAGVEESKATDKTTDETKNETTNEVIYAVHRIKVVPFSNGSSEKQDFGIFYRKAL